MGFFGNCTRYQRGVQLVRTTDTDDAEHRRIVVDVLPTEARDHLAAGPAKRDCPERRRRGVGPAAEPSGTTSPSVQCRTFAATMRGALGAGAFCSAAGLCCFWAPQPARTTATRMRMACPYA